VIISSCPTSHVKLKFRFNVVDLLCLHHQVREWSTASFPDVGDRAGLWNRLQAHSDTDSFQRIYHHFKLLRWLQVFFAGVSAGHSQLIDLKLHLPILSNFCLCICAHAYEHIVYAYVLVYQVHMRHHSIFLDWRVTMLQYVRNQEMKLMLITVALWKVCVPMWGWISITQAFLHWSTFLILWVFKSYMG